jgi:hypothetical protein
MNKEFTPYEQALALKELGFNEPCFAFYSKIYGLMTTSPTNKVNEFAGEVILPLYQQAFRWFREKYNLDNWVYCSDENKGYFAIIVSHRKLVLYNEIKNTYKEAEQACLIKLIEIVKKK